jgi:ATP-binding cassette subfamily B protein
MLLWLWQFVSPYRMRLVVAIIALIATAVLTLSLGQGIKLMIDEGFSSQSTVGLANALSVVGLIIFALSVGAYFRFYMVSWLGERVVADIRKKLYRHLVSLPPSFFEDNLAGEIQSRVTTGYHFITNGHWLFFLVCITKCPDLYWRFDLDVHQ